ncbi:hypothetical protein F2Q69_00039310 [Brassica cretica]|uniref:Uncharacterized protein n=1 Tax=Brassica cretica TaxID=69181 RepID=A0A8S9SD15_BRACR|nr:hypothetical protein F2Q69_00039310 [Brassica cretica]
MSPDLKICNHDAKTGKNIYYSLGKIQNLSLSQPHIPEGLTRPLSLSPTNQLPQKNQRLICAYEPTTLTLNAQTDLNFDVDLEANSPDYKETLQWRCFKLKVSKAATQKVETFELGGERMRLDRMLLSSSRSGR